MQQGSDVVPKYVLTKVNISQLQIILFLSQVDLKLCIDGLLRFLRFIARFI